MSLPLDIDEAGLVLGDDDGEQFFVALHERVRACLLEGRRPTAYDLALGFQIGSVTAEQVADEDELQEKIAVILGVLWDGLVDDWTAALQREGGMMSRAEVERLLDVRAGAVFRDLVEDFRTVAVQAYRCTVVAALCVVAGTMQVEEVPPDWPPRRR